MTVKEASQKLQKSEQTIRAWIKTGKLKANKQNGKWHIEISSLPSYKTDSKKTENVFTLSEITKALEKGLSRVVSEVKTIVNQNEKGEIYTNTIEKVKELEEKNQQLKRRVEEQSQEMFAIKEYIKQLEISLKAVQEQQKQPQIKKEYFTKPLKRETKSKRKSPLQDESKAETWVWNNVNQWLNSSCGLKGAKDYTWKELAENLGDKVRIDGQEVSTRTLLEKEANSEEKSWYRVKAKAALQLIEDKSLSYCHYNHPVEIGY